MTENKKKIENLNEFIEPIIKDSEELFEFCYFAGKRNNPFFNNYKDKNGNISNLKFIDQEGNILRPDQIKKTSKIKEIDLNFECIYPKRSGKSIILDFDTDKKSSLISIERNKGKFNDDNFAFLEEEYDIDKNIYINMESVNRENKPAFRSMFSSRKNNNLLFNKIRGNFFRFNKKIKLKDGKVVNNTLIEMNKIDPTTKCEKLEEIFKLKYGNNWENKFKDYLEERKIFRLDFDGSCKSLPRTEKDKELGDFFFDQFGGNTSEF